MHITSQIQTFTPQANETSSNDAQLMQAAKSLEATFLSEMLKSSGLGKTPSAFGGGTGEGQFSSFLVQSQAEQMVEAGGIGLAQQLFETLKEYE